VNRRDEAAFAYLTGRALMPGETVVWTGRPAPAAAARAPGGPGPVATLIVAGAVLWLTTRAMLAADPLLPLPALLLIGLWVVSTPARHRWRAGRLYYVVTNRRALVIDAAFGLRHAVLPPGPFDREDLPDGTASFQPRGEVVGLRGGFWGVDDADACERALAALP
jgi:hypothetical protein